MTEQIDLLFATAVRGMRGADAAARRSSGRGRAGRVRDRPRSAAWTSSTPSSAAGTSTSPPAGCAPRARASTRSARPGTRATPPSPRRSGPPTRRCCTTARAPSSSPGPRQGGGHDRAARRAARARGRRPRSRSPAAGTRCSASHDLAVIPQTSTIASHLPRAVGRGVRPSQRGPPARAWPGAWPDDAVDGVQLRRRVGEPLHRDRRDQRRAARRLPGHADAAAVRLRGQRHRHQRRAPRRAGSRPPTAAGQGCEYFDGRRLRPGRSATTARDRGRGVGPEHRRPAFLHLRTVRLMGHAGSDVEAAYRTPAEIAADLRPRPAARHRPAAGRGRRR